jgi:hypothetical protein
MAIRRFVVPVVTDGSGAAEEYSPKISGKIISLRYVKGDFADGVDFVITAETAGRTIWSEENVNASATRHPRTATHSTAGAASLYAALGEAVNGKIALADDRVKIVIASGGDTKSGAFHITVDA